MSLTCVLVCEFYYHILITTFYTEKNDDSQGLMILDIYFYGFKSKNHLSQHLDFSI